MKSSVSDLQAIGYAVAGFTLWVFSDTTIKLLGASHLPANEIMGFLGLFVVTFMIARGLWRGDAPTLRPRKVGSQAVRASLDLMNNVCLVIALRHISLTLFYILVFLNPMVTTLLAAVFLRESLNRRKVLAILAGFAGVVVAVDPFHASRQGDWIGFAASMVCVITFSINMVWTRRITRTESPESLTCFSGAMMALVGFGLMPWHAAPLTWHLLATLCALGLFCGLGNICFYTALKHTSPATVSQFHYTQLLTGSALGYLIWRSAPTPMMLLGGVLITGAGLAIAMQASRQRMPVAVPNPVPEGGPLPVAVPD
jgi:drug/metabolite transporter (DMT)-like permease